MSDDFIETIWAQYAVETEEHIEGIESLLVRADGGELSGEEISSLFRAFHSLKGLSRVMELGALEAVAHRAEDLLGLVREGVTGLDKPTVDVLLRALDAIKGLRDIAVAERSDGQKPEALCKELEAAFRWLEENGIWDTAEQDRYLAHTNVMPGMPLEPLPDADSRESSPKRGGGPAKLVEGHAVAGASPPAFGTSPVPLHHPADGPPPRSGEEPDGMLPPDPHDFRRFAAPKSKRP